MTKGLWVFCPSPMFSKTCTFPYFYILSPLLIFSSFFSPSPQPLFHKPYLQSKTFLNIVDVPSNAVFCSNAVLITTPTSMRFSSFFDVLPSALTTTGMTLILLMFYIPLFLSLVPGISQFSPSLFC